LPIRITREAKPNPVYRVVRDAWQAFQAGDDARASGLYRRALAREPRNRDALLGLAAIDIRAGRPEAAQEHYLRLLAANPQDRVALAALTGLQSGRDPVRTESRLKLLLDKDPDAAYLHFALGNVYVLQSRWPEAQRAFFNAYAADRENPDYVYNLAVALDHLGQHETALSFYRTALGLAEGGAGGAFDPAAVQQRVRSLSARPPDTPS
jgi:tetratricopeptide (TPR) repeat protein